MSEVGPPQPEAVSPEADLDYDVIIVRYDRQRESVVVDLGSVETYAALTMLRIAMVGIEEEIEPAIVISDLVREMDFYEDEDDDDDEDGDDSVS